MYSINYVCFGQPIPGRESTTEIQHRMIQGVMFSLPRSSTELEDVFSFPVVRYFSNSNRLKEF